MFIKLENCILLINTQSNILKNTELKQDFANFCRNIYAGTLLLFDKIFGYIVFIP